MYTLENQADAIDHILGAVRLEAPIDPATFGIIHDQQGSLDMLGRWTGGKSTRVVEFLGFFTPASLGIEGLPPAVDNIDELQTLRRSQVPLSQIVELTSLPRVNKGVGARLYNTPEALASWHDYGRPTGLYSVRMGHIHDARTATDHTLQGRARRIGEYGVKQFKAKYLGVDAVVNEVHMSYGDADAVLMTPPPRAELRARMRGAQATPIPATMLIVRDRSRMYRLGSLVPQG